MKVKAIQVKGLLDAVGVYNYNKVGFKSYIGKTGETEFAKNHNMAKTDNEGIDYISSRCIRNGLFSDLQPAQPTKEECAKMFVKLASSLVGLLRGYMSTDNACKRKSPLHVADAYTVTDKSVIVYDQGTSSNPDKDENSLFSKDNAPKRKQAFEAAINLKELQFLPIESNQNSVIGESDVEEYTKGLSETFKSLESADTKVKVDKYEDKTAVFKIARKGVLLSQDQIRSLVRESILRIVNFHGIKTSASVKFDPNSLVVTFVDHKGMSHEVRGLNEVLKIVDEAEFHHFYQKAA